jgi:thiamine biosynthesis lipoprotein
MGTLVGVSLRGSGAAQLEDVARDVFAEIARLEGILSEWQAESPVSQVNAAAGKQPVVVPPELVEVAELATCAAHATAGAFDPTWAALASCWRFDAVRFRVPSAARIAAARKRVDYRDVVVDANARTLFLRRRGMRLGLGGVAKAYVAERAAELAVDRGARDALVDAGGDLVARSRRTAAHAWQVALRDPRSAAVDWLGTVRLVNQAIATSGDYEHFVDVRGRRYHHLLDPRSGRPARACRSATVVAPSGALADALSTALFVLGPDGLDVVMRAGAVAALVVLPGRGRSSIRARGGIVGPSKGRARNA